MRAVRSGRLKRLGTRLRGPVKRQNGNHATPVDRGSTTSPYDYPTLLHALLEWKSCPTGGVERGGRPLGGLS